jgi:2-isopropylmalate synthase
VLIASSDGTREWGTVGVNDNIVEASLQALVDSLEYALTADARAVTPSTMAVSSQTER